MSDFLSEFLNENTSYAEMPAGINENCFLAGVVSKSDNVKVTKHTFIKFQQLDDDNIVSEFEGSWWGFDHTKKDFVYDNYAEYINQLIYVLKCYIDEEVVISQFNSMVYGERTFEEVQEECLTRKGLKALVEASRDAFVEMITPYVGDRSKVMRVKVVPDRTGRRLAFPQYNAFCEPQSVEETKLYISDAEQNRIDGKFVAKKDVKDVADALFPEGGDANDVSDLADSDPLMEDGDGGLDLDGESLEGTLGEAPVEDNNDTDGILNL